ncbi:MAG TPA: sugar phosphate nucleotidyltransferase, partial [Terricaulis sp.]|nr:sugar phosphate nucleotidyltransferase [Terricaulis sp.]
MPYHVIPAIMSGGSGTRLWPTSTERFPKQFHSLIGQDTLIQATIQRVRGAIGDVRFGAPIILANAQHQALVHEQLAAIDCTPAAVALEPMGRNTAATAALAAMLAQEQDKDALVLLLPADHVIADAAGFRAAIARAAPFARDRIITFGITPNRPATGYGYIKQGAELGEGVFAIERFKEKPNAATAQSYLDEGGYCWNAGIFLFSPAVLLREFAAAPEIREKSAAALAGAQRDGATISFSRAAFEAIPKAPLDTAVMEATRFGAVAPCDIGWADIGSWDEVHRLSPHDEAG